MKNVTEEIISKTTAIAPLVLTTSPNVTEITNIVLLIIGIVSSIISTSFTIWKWYIKSIHDQKITIEEIEDLEEKITRKEKRK